MQELLRRRALQARAEVTRGTLHGAALAELIHSVAFVDRDAWIDEVLGIELPPPDVALPRGSVPYLPCGVDEIVTMVREVPLRADDELVDLGSGLGRVVMLGHLLSGARACGIEIQEPLVRRARARCAELAIAQVTFVHANAAELDLDGSVFFLYAPFNGAMLTAVITRLAAVARRRPIVVCAVGMELHDIAWLTSRQTSSRALIVYESATPAR
ncbi:MAG TPA: class I SAM-dependent methyltransferase [Kofleriaceae bacterium]